MSFKKSVYNRLPYALQNAAISAEGLRLRQIRRGNSFTQYLAEANERWAWEKSQVQNYQLNRLKKFLIHAQQTSPYYTEVFNEHRFNPSAIREISDLELAPILEKDLLRNRTNFIRSKNVKDRDIATWVHTSGSTGSPIHVGYTKNDIRERMAALYRLYHQYGISTGERSVRFSGQTIFPNVAETRPPWRFNAGDNQLFMSSYHLSEYWLPRYVAKIESYNPQIIDGYPSAISLVASYIIENGKEGRIRPKIVCTTSETLTDVQRSLITRAFGGCPVVNQYASAEGAPFITENKFGEHVLNIDTGVFEFVRPGTNQKAEQGELAELVVTGFHTTAFPLIRYRIGDTVITDDFRKAQDCSMPIIQKIVGREDDIVQTPDRGNVVLHQIFKHTCSTIAESQIEQVSPREFVLRIVPGSKTFESHHVQPILREAYERLGDVKIVTEFVGLLPRGPNGKVRTVIAFRK